MSSSVIGNLISYFLFQDQEILERDTWMTLGWILTSVTISGVLAMFLLRPTPWVEKKSNDDVSMLTTLNDSISLFTTANMLMFSVTMFFTGLNQSLWAGVYSGCIGWTKGYIIWHFYILWYSIFCHKIWTRQKVPCLSKRDPRGSWGGGGGNPVWDARLHLHEEGSLAHRCAGGPSEPRDLLLHVHQLPHGGQWQGRDRRGRVHWPKQSLGANHQFYSGVLWLVLQHTGR